MDEDESGEDVDIYLNLALDALHKKLEAKISHNEIKTHEKLSFLSKDVVFHVKLAEDLLTSLSDLEQINDLTLTLFDDEVMHLKKFKIDNASKLTESGLQVLHGHNLQELQISNLVKATVNDLIESLNDWTCDNLKLLNVSNSTFVDAQKHTVVVALSKLQNLTSLNVSGTEFNKNSLEMVMDDLKKLEQLDISNTKVREITALLKAKDRLKSLSIAELRLSGTPSAHIDVLSQLSELRHLDISDNTAPHPHDELLETLVPNIKLNVSDFLVQCRLALPNLVSLDISGMSSCLFSSEMCQI